MPKEKVTKPPPDEKELAKRAAALKPPPDETDDQFQERLKRYRRGGPFGDPPYTPKPRPQKTEAKK